MEQNLAVILESKKRLDKRLEEEFKNLTLSNTVNTKKTLLAMLNNEIPSGVEALSGLLQNLEMDLMTRTSNRKVPDVTEKETESNDVGDAKDNSTKKAPGRPRRKAFNDASKTFNQQVKIKTERISEVVQPESISVQEEENMPPPALPAKRGRRKGTTTVKVERSKRTTRTRGTKVQDSIQSSDIEDAESIPKGKISDVILIHNNIDTIHLDGDDDNEVKLRIESARNVSEESTKRTRSSSPEAKGKPGRPKRTKRTKKETQASKVSDASVYEDAVNILPGLLEPRENQTKTKLDANENKEVTEPSVAINRLSKELLEQYKAKNHNATVTISKPTAINETVVIQKSNIANETVVIEKPKVINPADEIKDIMTDDDSIEIELPSVVIKTKQIHKQLFSSFENSPVKKKVEAFEKLGATVASTSRVTRTKTKQKDKNAEVEQQPKSRTPSKLSTRPGYVTPPTTSKFIPSLARSNSYLSESAKKTLSNFKIKVNPRDYEQLRIEKEAEALRKKEAMLVKQTEEKRRKREEKEKKAKQQREQLEKEKLRNQELQKELKLEKQEKLQQEKLEQLQKQREEADKRRLLAKQKQEELRRDAERKQRVEDQLREEAIRLLEQKAKQRQRDQEKIPATVVQDIPAQVPIFMLRKAPLLPTPDCYDSDDDNAPKPKNVQLRDWGSKEAITVIMRINNNVDSKLQNTLFCLKAKTPNLLEMMPNIDRKKLRRNSSAIWNKVPRFTMMLQLHEDF